MCGIAGFAGLSNETLLRQMTDSLRHRGPDESGFHHKDGVGLGSRRLSIIDLAGGTQPIFGEKGDAVVFNGEIYNFKILREQLIRKGHVFRTHSDTETIIHLYEDKGIEAFKDLSGMFAIAIWDAKAKKLILARDPLGVKPLYYASVGGRIYFGSEVKALRAVPEVSSEINLPALDHYFSYLYIPAPASIYRSIQKLLPGQWLAWQNGKVDTGIYWRPEIRTENFSLEEAAKEADTLLAKIVDDQKVADVPIGLFLSGGLDSSAVAYYAAKSGTKPEAFVAYYSTGGENFDEREKAGIVARHIGLRINELCIEPKVPEAMDDIVQAFDEPMADSSALPNYWISRLIRKNVKVALTGIGGDEVFGGYPRYIGAQLLERYRLIPTPLRRLMRQLAPVIPEQVSSRNVGSWAKRFLEYGIMPPEQAYVQWMSALSRQDKRSLYAPAFSHVQAISPSLEAAFKDAPGDILQKILAVDLTTYLPDDLLTLADRTSMAASLEVRVPLCDQRLVEFALKLRSSLRVRGFNLKLLLKRILKDKLPPEILAQKKQGFMIPIGNWFKSELRPFLEESITGLADRGVISRDGVRTIAAEHLDGRRNRTDVLWSIVLLEHWFKKYHPAFKFDGASRVSVNGRRRIMVVSDFIFPDDEGGSARVAWESAKQLKDLGFDVLICTLGRIDGLKYSESIDGLEVRRLWCKRLNRGMFLWPNFVSEIHRDLDKILSEFQPDQILAHHLLIAWLLQSHSRLRDVPFAYFYHSSWPVEFQVDNPDGLRSEIGFRAREFLEKKVLRRVDSIVTISEYMRRDVLGRYSLSGDRVSRIPSGVDLNRFAFRDKAEVKQELGLSGRPTIVTIRNLRPRMGLDLLLDALPLLIPNHPKMELIIGGIGPKAEALKLQAARLGIQNYVRFIGRVPDAQLPKYYQAADLFVLPSRELEGFGLVLLEAMACGTPCVGTPVGGIPEVIRPVSPGLIADAVESKALANAIERGLAYKYKPEDLREYVESNYGWDRMAKALANHLC